MKDYDYYVHNYWNDETVSVHHLNFVEDKQQHHDRHSRASSQTQKDALKQFQRRYERHKRFGLKIDLL